jgi:hypothetical protein
MTCLKRTAWVGVMVVALGLCVSGAQEADSSIERPEVKEKPLVQMAILLDTSGSMSGLIDQARAELWAIVNEFIFARQKGITPMVQVALFEYGNDSLSPESGHVREVMPFTGDLDALSKALFALMTNGGSEYCGWVIQDAVKRLQWDESEDTLKVIFIAGNEPFTQGPVSPKQSCAAAIEQGVIVNTIHCGTEADGIKGQWRQGALMADGRYLNINHQQQVAYVEAPQDRMLAELNTQLNQTYLAFGLQGSEQKLNQHVQDGNAAGLSKEAAVQRVLAKSSANYSNSSWDLVDAVQQKGIKLEEIAKDQLPEPMKPMSTQQRREYVRARASERAKIQTDIQQLNEQRKAFLAQAQKSQPAAKKTLGSAIILAIREQAQEKEFVFPSEKPTEVPSTGAEK